MQADLDDLSTLSRLLDEALDLGANTIEDWLARLPAEHRHLIPRLRDMLVDHASKNACALDAGPKLSGDSLDSTTARCGERVGPYELIRQIGEGGMGTVWLATRADGLMRRRVALKLPRLAWGRGLAKRMAREREIGSLLEHPHIARLYDAGVDERERPYLALEYIDGKPIDAWCRDGNLPIEGRLRLFVQVVRAVAYAHARLVVHRDLKPSNVLVTADGEAHLLDFGIAKLLENVAGEADLTREQGRLYTPYYASPEQIGGETITVASDVYSLGVLLFELLTGRSPYKVAEDASAAVIEAAVLAGHYRPVNGHALDARSAKALCGEVDAIVGKALKRYPAHRYPTADALADDLERHLNGERVLAQPDSFGYRAGKLMRKHRAVFAASTFAMLAVLTGAGVSVGQAHRANESAERARTVTEFVVAMFNVNAINGGGAQMPAELLLTHSAAQIETKFAGQPELQADLYAAVSKIFVDLGAAELAVTYLTKQLDALSVSNGPLKDRVEATILLASAMLRLNRGRDAEMSARHAIELSMSSAELQPLAWLEMARVLQFTDGARPEILRYLNLIDQRVAESRGPSTIGAASKALRADMLSVDNHFDEALPIFKDAIAQASAASGPASSEAALIRLKLAFALIGHGRGDESTPFVDEALASWRSVGGAKDVMAALRESSIVCYRFLNNAIGFREAERMLQVDQAILAAHGAIVPLATRASVDLDLGTVYAYAGDINSAHQLMSSGLAVWRARGGGWLDAREAVLLFWQGDVQRAEDLWAGVQAKVLSVRGDSPYVAYIYAFRAFNLMAGSRPEQAEALLASAPVIGSLRGARDGDDYRYVIPRAMARIKLERGHPDEAWRLLPAPETEGPGERYPFEAQILRGEILCALGRRTDALPILEESIARQALAVHQNHPELARARAVTGQCALANGDRKRAAALATLAHASFVAQPDVSPYFKRASEKLDGMLGRTVAHVNVASR